MREFALHCETGRQARRVAFSLIGAPGYACVHAHPHDLLPACSLPWGREADGGEPWTFEWLSLHQPSWPVWRRSRRRSVMILPQVHLRKPCYDFYFL